MLLHEALARSRQREAEEAARRYRLARSVAAAHKARRPRRSLLASVLGTVLGRAARRRAAAARRTVT